MPVSLFCYQVLSSYLRPPFAFALSPLRYDDYSGDEDLLDDGGSIYDIDNDGWSRPVNLDRCSSISADFLTPSSGKSGKTKGRSRDDIANLSTTGKSGKTKGNLAAIANYNSKGGKSSHNNDDYEG